MKKNKYLLDTSALMALYFREAGIFEIRKLLTKSLEKEIELWLPFMSLMEFFYGVWRREGETSAKQAYQNIKTIGLQEMHYSEALLIQAATFKANRRISLGDAWVAASAYIFRCRFSA